jgi:hypothetical protein
MFFVSLSILIVMYVPFCAIVLFSVLFVFYVLFVCECVLDNCHRDMGALFDYTEVFPCLFLICKANSRV